MFESLAINTRTIKIKNVSVFFTFLLLLDIKKRQYININAFK